VSEDVRIRCYFSKPKGVCEQNILGYTALDHVPNSVRTAQETSIKQDCKWRTPWRSAQSSPKCSLLSERHTVSRHTCTCNSMYVHNSSTALSVATFTALYAAILNQILCQCDEQCSNILYALKLKQGCPCTTCHNIRGGSIASCVICYGEYHPHIDFVCVYRTL